MITQRQISILNAIVEDYVELGQPIGSTTLIKRHNVQVSPATIRNEMKLLEENRLIEKTHSSSGRVPSEAGFRLYVNQLLQQKNVNEPQSKLNLNTLFSENHFDISTTLNRLAQLFSDRTHYTTIVVGPDHSKSPIIDAHLIKVNPQHLIVVLIYQTGHVKHLHLSSSVAVEDKTVIKISNYISKNLEVFLNNGQQQHIDTYRLMGFDDDEVTVLLQVYYLLRKHLNSESSRIYLGGKHQLIERLDETTVTSIQPILKYVESGKITQLIDQISDAPIHISIGSEIDQNLQGIAIVTRPYTLTNDIEGHIAVVGPTAMRYQNVIQLLSQTR
ncbi:MULTISPECIES: heat-inducible transcriptional repressor HrcA [unclassified Staphylococcus]|uniref:heat-inducible transcriptional repressor HrcA n=1 Tax=unclassified Staphylococcus TaxID=91994 RepID=UPI0021CF8065|nr:MULTISPECIES: heat-inducible transcriptional repressor HrcA [unclassified Staphylococcus]UXR68636.1 heat-inducible transcriptional repressor HrcA [Staphylococcus sp. IVB6246]UXR70694.1 heat-inducible transcriptional repressor HrcA [Staphylococcus sp. IVB6240]UXR75220.1 heat-inducible transcriptional repressor HrcA [Staphylococcus sp. IVB6233]UXR79420.1 heat-inducible transcriptional repressor HrcA [Staphylococcus sp. IVB6218]